jgi:hypothetical protein
MTEEIEDVNIHLGTCCACEKDDGSVRNLVMIPKLNPVPGRGWGCAQCGLPQNGASVVVCDPCLESNAPYKVAIDGYPADKKRIPFGDLKGTHEHDMSKHPGEQ